MHTTMIRRLGVGAGALAVAFVSAACNSDRIGSAATGPTVPALRMEVVDPPTVVPALTRDVPLAHDITVSVMIGRTGGTLEIPEAGLKLDVPANAVRKPTLFTATAKAGSMVAYDFGPAGSKFSSGLKVVQDLKGTSWWKLADPSVMEGAYYADDSQLDTSTGKATVNEFVTTNVQMSVAKTSFVVKHFSGYIIATGRSSAY